MKLTMEVNGAPAQLEAPPMKRLLDVLREDLGLTGTKEGCGEGECGACSVLLDGVLVNACLVPACQAEGTKVVTVEGLATGEALHPVQACFVEDGGAQCGICTPGMIVAAVDFLSQRAPEVPSREELREALSGNLCRCTGYQKIVDAVERAARQLVARSAR
jgi:aerobic carbon-monoxide dehydrogenase small subunit